MFFSKSFFFGFALFVGSLHVAFFLCLQKWHPKEWNQHGFRTALFTDIQGSWNMTKYILRGKFECLQDVPLIWLGRLLQLSEWLYVLGFCGFILLYVCSLLR
jgi:hypothetical protein